MSIPVSFSAKDLLRQKVVIPGWYKVRITNIDVEPTVTAKGPSINYKLEHEVICAEDGNTQFQGVPVIGQFNSKAMGMTAGLFMALGVTEEQLMNPNNRFDLESCKDQEVFAFIENNEYQGRISNRINGKYRAV